MNKGFFSYYVIVIFTCIALVFQSLLVKTVKTEELVNGEMDYITCLYGVERGIVWLMGYLTTGHGINEIKSDIYQNNTLHIGIESVEIKEDTLQCIIYCEHQKSHLVVKKKVTARYKKQDSNTSVNIIDMSQL